MKKDLILYHGSNKAVLNPSVNKSKITNDFGNGFYLTADRDQAIKWAKRKAYLGGVPTLNVYCLLDVDSDLNFLRFNADLEWVKFIIMNRTHSLPNSKSFKQDIIYGPIADGRLFTVIRDVKHGKMTLNEALIKMKPNAYAKQYCLKTKKALLHLKFIGKEYF